MSKPLVGYLDPFLYQAFADVRNGLRAVFGTKNPYTLMIPGTGSVVNGFFDTPRVPEGVDDARVRKQLLDEHGSRSREGSLAGKVFRIGVMGLLATDAVHATA